VTSTPSSADLVSALNLKLVGPLAAGEFGATEVEDRRGRKLVLKVIGNPALKGDVNEGIRLAGNLRAAGYPAPEYVGLGEFQGLLWTLQELLPGKVPVVMTPSWRSSQSSRRFGT
jgi:hypothetical protein